MADERTLASLPDLCLRVWQKNPGVLAEIQQLATGLGLRATMRGEQLDIRGKVGTAVTLGLDPITAFVVLAFGLVGARWAADPGISELFEETKKRWKQAAKAARERRGKP
mgnify:CR=1 FL=1